MKLVSTEKEFYIETDELVAMVLRLQRGETVVEDEIYKVFRRKVHGQIHKKVNDFADAKSIMHDVFIEIGKKIGLLRKPEAFVTWCNRIVNAKCNAYLRKKYREIERQKKPPKISKEEKVNTIVIGYNKGLKEKGIKNDNLTNKEKSKINQNFTRIPISRLINKIKYKCEEYSINCIVINESYTSLSSFYDNDKIDKQEKYSGKRIKRGLYLTKNNIEVNADVNAALNILRKSKPKDEVINHLRDRGLTIPKRLQVSF